MLVQEAVIVRPQGYAGAATDAVLPALQLDDAAQQPAHDAAHAPFRVTFHTIAASISQQPHALHGCSAGRQLKHDAAAMVASLEHNLSWPRMADRRACSVVRSWT